MEVVVAFQRHEVTTGQRFVHRGRQDAKVGGDGHGLIVRRVDAVTHTGHIVAGGERRHAEIADVLFPAGHAAQFAGRGHDAVRIQKIQRRGCTVDGQRILFQEGGQALHMVAVLVGHKDARAITDVQVQRLEGRTGRPHALAHINDEVALPTAHHAAVAGRAGIQ